MEGNGPVGVRLRLCHGRRGQGLREGKGWGAGDPGRPGSASQLTILRGCWEGLTSSGWRPTCGGKGGWGLTLASPGLLLEPPGQGWPETQGPVRMQRVEAGSQAHSCRPMTHEALGLPVPTLLPLGPSFV